MAKKINTDALIEMFATQTSKMVDEKLTPLLNAVDKQIGQFSEKLDALGNRLHDMELEADRLENRVLQNSQRVEAVSNRQSIQQEKIDEIEKRLNEMAADDGAAVIRKKDGRVALDKDAVYDELDRMTRNRHREAMRELSRLGIVLRNGYDGKYTTPVWDPRKAGCVRAVIILDGGSADD